jgi:hypothetical protein
MVPQEGKGVYFILPKTYGVCSFGRKYYTIDKLQPGDNVHWAYIVFLVLLSIPS